MQVSPPELLPQPQPYGVAPLRRPASLRRTTSLDVTWPGGRFDAVEIRGTGRDIFSPRDDLTPRVLSEDQLYVHCNDQKMITALHTVPARPGCESFVGVPATGAVRKTLQQIMPDARENAAPVFLLIDDLPGAALVADWAWSTRPQLITDNEREQRRSRLLQMAGVCTGFSPGSSALQADGNYQDERAARVLPLPHPDDPQGWHELADIRTVSLRRARRMDIWLTDCINVDAMFQDSASLPDGQRIAVHEYSLTMQIDPLTLTILTLDVTPHILPYHECPGAVAHCQSLCGEAVANVRNRIMNDFRGVRGCTHLNDMVRALADIPLLLQKLRRNTAR